jgi:hypothetical protein
LNLRHFMPRIRLPRKLLANCSSPSARKPRAAITPTALPTKAAITATRPPAIITRTIANKRRRPEKEPARRIIIPRAGIAVHCFQGALPAPVIGMAIYEDIRAVHTVQMHRPIVAGCFTGTSHR